MERNPLEYRYAGAVLYEGKLLFVPGDPVPELPNVTIKGLFKMGAFLGYLTQLGIRDPQVIHQLPERIVSTEDVNYIVRAFLIKPGQIDNIKDFILIDAVSTVGMGLGPISSCVAHRVDMYEPYYFKVKRETPLLPQDLEKIKWEKECLQYFKASIPGAELREFYGLVDSASSLRRINEAFADICNRYRCNPKQYTEYLKYREKRRAALR